MELAVTHQARRLDGPIALAELTEQVRARTQRCSDHANVVLGETRLETDGTWHYNGQAGQLTRHAFNQLCARLALPGGGTVPAGYLTRCPAPLVAAHLNHWLARSEHAATRLLVRTHADAETDQPVVRAVLSDRYARADHLPVLELLQAMLSGSDLALRAWSLDDQFLTLRLLAPEAHAASRYDPLQVGLHIANSEIGLGRLTIEALIVRQVCSNGLVVRIAELGGLQRRHISRAGEDLSVVIAIGLRRVLGQAMEAAGRFVRLRQVPAPPPVEAFVQRTAQEAGLPAALVPAAVDALEGGTMYDVINALTRAAQHLPVTQRVRVETVMSRYLAHTPNYT